MNKIIIYGAGKMFWENIKRIDFSEVVCISDEKLFMTPLCGCNIIRKKRILEYQFDYIVIFNKWNTKEIREDLIELGVSANKIIHWAYYLYIMKYQMPNISEDSKFLLKDWFGEKKGQAVLDIGGGMTLNCLYMSDKHITTNIARVDNLETGNADLIDRRLYAHCKSEIGEDRYDTIICLDYFLKHSLEEWNKLFWETFESSRYMVVSVPYRGFCRADSSWDNWEVENEAIIIKASYNMVQVFVIDKWKVNKNLKIYVVTHKPFIPPKDAMYVPVYAGMGNDNPMGIQGEMVEDNITYLNRWINECTVLYWIWKHTKETYVGINHYRRYFSFTKTSTYERIIKASEIMEDLHKFDMLVAPLYDSYPFSLRKQMEVSVNKDAFELGYNNVRSAIEMKHPDYIREFDIYFKGHSMYPCNMFITNRVVLNAYCSWLFDILPMACADFDVDSYDDYSQRMIGFMAERLLTLWIIHNNISVKEIPMVTIE